MSSTMSSTNIFSLDNILADLPGKNSSDISGGLVKKNVSTSLSDNYIEIDKNALTDVATGTYVRYYDGNGVLKPGGGKIKNILHNSDGDKVLVLTNYNVANKRLFVWNVPFSNISKIFKHTGKNKKVKAKPGAKNEQRAPQKQNIDLPEEPEQSVDNEPPVSLEDDILNQIGGKMLFNDGEMLRQKVDALENDLKRMDSDLKKLFVLVKRLYTNVFKPGN